MQYLSLGAGVIASLRCSSSHWCESSNTQPGLVGVGIDPARKTFRDMELYPTVVQNAVALAHSLVGGHSLVDGNKRDRHAAMAAFLILATCYRPAKSSRNPSCYSSLCVNS
jgi:hypothetical protein